MTLFPIDELTTLNARGPFDQPAPRGLRNEPSGVHFPEFLSLSEQDRKTVANVSKGSIQAAVVFSMSCFLLFQHISGGGYTVRQTPLSTTSVPSSHSTEPPEEPTVPAKLLQKLVSKLVTRKLWLNSLLAAVLTAFAIFAIAMVILIRAEAAAQRSDKAAQMLLNQLQRLYTQTIDSEEHVLGSLTNQIINLPKSLLQYREDNGGRIAKQSDLTNLHKAWINFGGSSRVVDFYDHDKQLIRQILELHGLSHELFQTNDVESILNKMK